MQEEKNILNKIKQYAKQTTIGAKSVAACQPQPRPSEASTSSTDPPFAHPRPNQAYAGKTQKQEDRLTTRADQVLLARIRSGKHKAFRKFKHALDGFSDPGCPLCDAPEHTLEHWFLECAGTAESAYRLFGFTPRHLGVISERTKKAVAHARATLLAPKK